MIWIIVAGLAIILGGILISTVTPAILPPQGSAEARQVDELFRFMLAIGGAIFLLVQGMLVYSVIRFRAKPGDRADGPPMHGNATLELVWTVIPAIIVLILTIYSLQVWTATRSVKLNEIQIGAVGARFAWTFNYDVPREALPSDVVFEELDQAVQDDFNDDGKVVFSSPQLHTWVNQPVNIVLDTQDVLHSFWIPGMRIKQDLLTGRTTNIRFTPVEAGVYRIVCAELCGSGHGNMAGQVGADGELLGAWLIVHPDEETYLREFFDPQVRAKIFPPEDPAERGRLILSGGSYPCAACHVLTDLGWAGNVGPSLNGIANRTQRLEATGLPSMEEYIHNSIRHPGDYLVPGYGNLMPQFNANAGEANYMPDEDLDAIVAYLLTQTGN